MRVLLVGDLLVGGRLLWVVHASLIATGSFEWQLRGTLSVGLIAGVLLMLQYV